MTPELVAGRPDAAWVLTCEHASEALPPHVGWPPDDFRLVGTHWAVDLGIGAITRQLAAAMEAPAVLATVSRLWVDLNRGPDDPTLFRTVCDGLPVHLNADLDDAERARRLEEVYHPYHRVVHEVVGGTPRANVLSMHSFTPIYENGPPRWMELGVLFDREEAMAERLAAHLADAGFAVALNEPWSGKGGLMHSCQSAADAFGRRALEIEVRQDLAVDPVHQARIVAAVKEGLGRLTTEVSA